MRTFFTLLTILSLSLLSNCQPIYPIVKRSSGFPPNDSTYYNFAVLDFSYSGLGLNKRLADRAADQFSNDLYTRLSFPVIDRTIVKAILKKHHISGRSSMSYEEIKTIARDIRATYFIFGTIQSTGSIETFSDESYNDNEIEISIRFIDIESGEMVCNIQQKEKSGFSLQRLLNNAIYNATLALKSEIY